MPIEKMRTDSRIPDLLQDAKLPFWPLLEKVDELVSESELEAALELLEPANRSYPDQPSILIRIWSINCVLDDYALEKEYALALRAYFSSKNIIPSPKIDRELSQSLFHCYISLGDYDAAEDEGHDYFSRSPDEESPYSEGYRNLCAQRQKWSDAEINEALYDAEIDCPKQKRPSRLQV